jgi:hypothetical protein
VSKQWDETRALTLTGFGGCFREHLDSLIGMQPGRFEKAWALFFEYVKDWCLGYSQEVALGSMRTLKTVLGFPQEETEISDTTRARLIPYWTTAWEEWASIGEGIIIRAASASAEQSRAASVAVSALASPALTGSADAPELPPADGGSAADFEHLLEPAADGLPSEISGEFTQETIGAFVSSFVDIYPTIRSLFSEANFKRLMRIMDNLLVYTTLAEPGSKYGKTVWDLDVLSPLQEAVLKTLAGLDASEDGLAEIIMGEMADYIKLPIRRGAASPTRRHSAPKIVPGKGMPQGPTFVTFSAKAMDASCEICERRKDSPSLYESGVLVSLIKAHTELMKFKYDCPSPGNRPSDIPLWRSAATSFLRLIGLALPSLRDLQGQVSPEGTATVFHAALEGISAFLLSPSTPPPDSTDTQLAADEAFDLSVLRTIETEIVPHLGHADVPEAVILQLVDTLRKGANLYFGAGTVHGATPLSPSKADVAGRKSVDAAGKPHKVNVLHIPVHREKFANECLDLLFRLCSDSLEGGPSTWSVLFDRAYSSFF